MACFHLKKFSHHSFHFEYNHKNASGLFKFCSLLQTLVESQMLHQLPSSLMMAITCLLLPALPLVSSSFNSLYLIVHILVLFKSLFQFSSFRSIALVCQLNLQQFSFPQQRTNQSFISTKDIINQLYLFCIILYISCSPHTFFSITKLLILLQFFLYIIYVSEICILSMRVLGYICEVAIFLCMLQSEVTIKSNHFYIVLPIYIKVLRIYTVPI